MYNGPNPIEVYFFLSQSKPVSGRRGGAGVTGEKGVKDAALHSSRTQAGRASAIFNM